MEKFNKIYSEIKRLNKTDPASSSERLCKLTEEVGELAKEVNKTTGRKVLKPGDTIKTIRLEIIDEAADVVQNTISLIDSFNITPNELMEAMIRKNKSWADKIKNGKRGLKVEDKKTILKNKAEPIVKEKGKKKNEQKRK